MMPGINRELLLDFFLTFSRFEFALKLAGLYRRQSGQHVAYEAKPDWNRLTTMLRGTFDANRTSELRVVVDRILNNPPFREVIAGGSIAWDTGGPTESLSEIDRLLICVRRIRNNVFHGGKYSSERNFDTERNIALLGDALVVLEECLRLAPNVKREYDAATP